MQTSDDCGCSGKSFPTSPSNPITRREFLKAASTVAVGATLSVLPVHPLSSLAASPIKGEDLAAALEIAVSDALYQEAVAELQALGLTFQPAVDAVRLASIQDGLTGFVLPHRASPSRRMGADLALTVDVAPGLVTSVHFLTGWSLVEMLEMASITFDVRNPLYEESRDGRIQYDTPPALIRPRIEEYWSFPRPNSPSMTDADLVETGWPPHAEDPAAGYWHYGGCSQAGWVVEREAWVYRGVQVRETLNVDKEWWVDLPVKQG